MRSEMQDIKNNRWIVITTVITSIIIGIVLSTIVHQRHPKYIHLFTSSGQEIKFTVEDQGDSIKVYLK